jgi:predicted nucleotidyltransferase
LFTDETFIAGDLLLRTYQFATIHTFDEGMGMAEAAVLRTVPEDIKRDIARGVAILKSGGCNEIYVFGSVAEGRVGAESDIDFAVRGCPPDRFFKLQGKLLIELSRSADLVDLDVDSEFAAFLERETVLIHVG